MVSSRLAYSGLSERATVEVMSHYYRRDNVPIALMIMVLGMTYAIIQAIDVSNPYSAGGVVTGLIVAGLGFLVLFLELFL